MAATKAQLFSFDADNEYEYNQIERINNTEPNPYLCK